MDLNSQEQNIDIRAIQKGDRKVFATLIEIYYEETFWYAKSLSRNDALAKDLTQEVFYKLWSKRKKIKDEVVIKGWLFRSVRNKFLDHVKKNRRQTQLLETTLADTLDTFIQRQNDEGMSKKLAIIEKEIQNLPKKCHEVFLLSKKEGLTNNEIAEHLGISLKTVEGHLTKALKTLKEKVIEKIQLLFMIFKHS
ncbi:RNA polymerase sigma factor [Flagellimonas profundi]|jgi:RNA polymerase sigma-70 factor (ECF subfamily)|uniref:RNA polymerase sigma-70 factor n=1 Tax=Flagellimonas profundi TaxID=2915620 RepID=A0ABS3FBY7_9FLAO|nr:MULTISPECIES: RNA polymerase sigma-70 factor [Allomuricauda]MBC32207.1 RNA polymerase sigma-70 factor [Allomuricauda sp.]MBO0340678.1 RNA polymerase sigma-70 factor [Allomuricauda profundi]|tara:strand:- start:711 stop:1292 length:582 start_codon:yes stop_codon:yes gene_type:complete